MFIGRPRQTTDTWTWSIVQSRMPSPERGFTAADALSHVDENTFEVGPGGLVGVEAEWLIFDRASPGRPVDFVAVSATLLGLELPSAGSISFEPGGQLEISTAPVAGSGPAADAVIVGRKTIQDRLDRAGLVLAPIGIDPLRVGTRVVDSPRYAAMEKRFDHDGPDGRVMMRSTAAVQVNVDIAKDPALQWKVAHEVGPLLTAIFANSPLYEGRRTGWVSTRMRTWLSMDPRRTHPALRTGDPTSDWSQYALDAQVMLIRLEDSRYETITETMNFKDWINNGHTYGFPTEDDFAYHLTTLFPPVRPRGRLEIRMIDALPDDLLRVATATVCSLLGPQGAEEISKRTWDAGSLWYEAARYGLSHPGLRRMATDAFEIALDVAEDSGVDANTRSMMATFFRDHVSVGRCPADDRLDRFDREGEVLPEMSREPACN